MPDYAAMYDSYWDDPSRWGSCSIRDLDQTAEAILATCGPGRLLDVGSGMGGLVRALLRLGVDATGLDVAQKCVDASNEAAAGRFVRGSLLQLPFEDGAFDTVVSTDVLEHLDEADVPAALAEMARVSRRFLFVRVATTPDRDGAWHLTVRERAWWERRCFEAGLRRHPLMLAAVAYDALESEGWQATLVLEKVPAAALARWPLESLKGERDLHMDMLREAGRRSDAHIARYHLACQFVRPGDTVLDVACGLGYGSAIVRAGSQAARVVGIDSSESAVAYARDCFGGGSSGACGDSGEGNERAGRPIEFGVGDAADLSRFGDASIDVVVSFETLEHLGEPGRFLDEARRVLRPGGRLVLSVPNDWTDETGRDPNPHHLQVYDWARLGAELGERFILEKRFAQIAGGGMKHREGARSLRDVALAPASASDGDPKGEGGNGPSTPPAEWWLAVAMKDPVGAATPYVESVYPARGVAGDDPEHSANVAAFGRDYENPWLVRAMVALGLRGTNKAELAAMARRVIEASGLAGGSGHERAAATPDVGAALCVLGYRLLDVPTLPAGEADAWLAQANAYESNVDARGTDAAPHARRWTISNAYLAGLLHLAVGRRGEARAAFQRCARMDVLAFSPLLASKTIDASFQAGLIAAADGDLDAARPDFRRGLGELTRVLDARDWTNILGSLDEPLTFGLVDLQQAVELAARCAFGLACLDHFRDRPGLAWTLVRRRALGDLKRWSEQQTGAIEWLREQRRELERALAETRGWISRQERGRSWLEQQRTDLEQRHAALAARLDTLSRESADERERLRGVIGEQRKSAEWLAAQRREMDDRLRERDQTIATLRAAIEAHKGGEKWLGDQKRELERRLAEQRESFEARLGERDARIAKQAAWSEQQKARIEALQAKIAALMEGRDWVARQAEALREQAEKPGA
ncbi:MAG: methyltransferase domain-containing protein [Phycisphaerales bacterium]